MAGGSPTAAPVIERVSTIHDSVLITEVRRGAAHLRGRCVELERAPGRPAINPMPVAL